MNQSDFEEQLKKQGFSEVELQTLAPRRGKGRHRHHFEIRGLVISGTFVVQQRGDAVAYRPGEIFSVAEGELHDEWIEADGAIVLVGRKFSETKHVCRGPRSRNELRFSAASRSDPRKAAQIQGADWMPL